jgi:cytochrome c peroxidase
LTNSVSSQGSQPDALFRPLDSDEGLGTRYDRLLNHATIRVLLDLPANVSLESNPTARAVIVHRGIPSVLDIGLETVLMHDGRAPNLEMQALDALLGHAEARRVPAERQLEAIADFERSLFSGAELRRFAQGGPAPALPTGITPEEIRGRSHFEPGGLCHLCHSGPMLNQTSASHPAGAGQRFENIFVSERNLIGNPVQTFLFSNEDGTTNRVETADPGLALIVSDPLEGIFVRGPINFFRIPRLWNVKNTAPYFHDNSARTLEEVLDHYRLYLPLSEQDANDIIAFLKLL